MWVLGLGSKRLAKMGYQWVTLTLPHHTGYGFGIIAVSIHTCIDTEKTVSVLSLGFLLLCPFAFRVQAQDLDVCKTPTKPLTPNLPASESPEARKER